MRHDFTTDCKVQYHLYGSLQEEFEAWVQFYSWVYLGAAEGFECQAGGAMLTGGSTGGGGPANGGGGDG